MEPDPMRITALEQRYRELIEIEWLSETLDKVGSHHRDDNAELFDGPYTDRAGVSHALATVLDARDALAGVAELDPP